MNSGRLSVPCTYAGLSLIGEDSLNGPVRTAPGAPCADAPVDDGFLLDHLPGKFTLLALNTAAPTLTHPIPVHTVTLSDLSPELRDRYLGDALHALYLIRPDQHVAARWSTATKAQVTAALDTATGQL